MSVLLRKLFWAGIWFSQLGFRYDLVTGLRIAPGFTRRFGKAGGTWLLPLDASFEGTNVISVGVGEDTSFDEQLMNAFSLSILALDPTPKAIQHAESVVKKHQAFSFLPLGFWDEDGEQCFHAPKDPTHVSHSIVALQGEAPAFTANCLTWTSLLKQMGLNEVYLLKMDIEGAEYRVLKSILASEVHPEILCLEFDETHSPRDTKWKLRIRESVKGLLAADYVLAGVILKGNYTFEKRKRRAEK